MNLKKLTKIIAFVMLIAIASPASASSNALLSDSTADNARAEQIMTRLNIIQSMDVANLSSEEKKDLRKELKGLKKESAALSNKGVYLSVGAIIIIILILILILK